MNKYDGTFDLKIAGKDLKIRFDWKALARIHTEIGRTVLANLTDAAPEQIARIIAIGSGDAITEEEVLASSPAFFPTIRSLDQALGYAYFGADGVEKIEAAAEDVKKKTLTQSDQPSDSPSQ